MRSARVRAAERAVALKDKHHKFKTEMDDEAKNAHVPRTST